MSAVTCPLCCELEYCNWCRQLRRQSFQKLSPAQRSKTTTLNPSRHVTAVSYSSRLKWQKAQFNQQCCSLCSSPSFSSRFRAASRKAMASTHAPWRINAWPQIEFSGPITGNQTWHPCGRNYLNMIKHVKTWSNCIKLNFSWTTVLIYSDPFGHRQRFLRVHGLTESTDYERVTFALKLSGLHIKSQNRKKSSGSIFMRLTRNSNMGTPKAQSWPKTVHKHSFSTHINGVFFHLLVFFQPLMAKWC